MSTRLRWGDRDWADQDRADHDRAGSGVVVPEPDGALVVDSFLAADGRVADHERHEERFARSCAELGLRVHPDRMAWFLRAARSALPATGRWFPRIEAHPGDPAPLVCSVRPAPPLTTEVRLWLPPEPDPRVRPRVKGPDLAVLAALRRGAQERGADDAVLLHPGDGMVLETAHSGLLWWRGETLCHPDPGLPVLPSVTARRVLEQARAEGVAVVAERCRPSELRGAEVWAVNALHGVRPVTGWVGTGPGGAQPPPDPRPVDADRLARYRAGHPSQVPDRPSQAPDRPTAPDTPSVR